MNISVSTSRSIQEILGQLIESVQCPICLELMSNPVSTNCNHRFCRFCLNSFYKYKRSLPCPLCKTSVLKRSIEEQSQLSVIIQNIKQLIDAYETDTGTKFSPVKNGKTFFPSSPEKLVTKRKRSSKRKHVTEESTTTGTSTSSSAEKGKKARKEPQNDNKTLATKKISYVQPFTQESSLKMDRDDNIFTELCDDTGNDSLPSSSSSAQSKASAEKKSSSRKKKKAQNDSLPSSSSSVQSNASDEKSSSSRKKKKAQNALSKEEPLRTSARKKISYVQPFIAQESSPRDASCHVFTDVGTVSDEPLPLSVLSGASNEPRTSRGSGQMKKRSEKSYEEELLDYLQDGPCGAVNKTHPMEQPKAYVPSNDIARRASKRNSDDISHNQDAVSHFGDKHDNTSHYQSRGSSISTKSTNTPGDESSDGSYDFIPVKHVSRTYTRDMRQAFRSEKARADIRHEQNCTEENLVMSDPKHEDISIESYLENQPQDVTPDSPKLKRPRGRTVSRKQIESEVNEWDSVPENLANNTLSFAMTIKNRIFKNRNKTGEPDSEGKDVSVGTTLAASQDPFAFKGETPIKEKKSTKIKGKKSGSRKPKGSLDFYPAHQQRDKAGFEKLSDADAQLAERKRKVLFHEESGKNELENKSEKCFLDPDWNKNSTPEILMVEKSIEEFESVTMNKPTDQQMNVETNFASENYSGSKDENISINDDAEYNLNEEDSQADLFSGKDTINNDLIKLRSPGNLESIQREPLPSRNLKRINKLASKRAKGHRFTSGRTCERKMASEELDKMKSKISNAETHELMFSSQEARQFIERQENLANAQEEREMEEIEIFPAKEWAALQKNRPGKHVENISGRTVIKPKENINEALSIVTDVENNHECENSILTIQGHVNKESIEQAYDEVEKVKNKSRENKCNLEINNRSPFKIPDAKNDVKNYFLESLQSSCMMVRPKEIFSLPNLSVMKQFNPTKVPSSCNSPASSAKISVICETPLTGSLAKDDTEGVRNSNVEAFKELSPDLHDRHSIDTELSPSRTSSFKKQMNTEDKDIKASQAIDACVTLCTDVTQSVDVSSLSTKSLDTNCHIIGSNEKCSSLSHFNREKPGCGEDVIWPRPLTLSLKSKLAIEDNRNNEISIGENRDALRCDLNIVIAPDTCKEHTTMQVENDDVLGFSSVPETELSATMKSDQDGKDYEFDKDVVIAPDTCVGDFCGQIKENAINHLGFTHVPETELQTSIDEDEALNSDSQSAQAVKNNFEVECRSTTSMQKDTILLEEEEKHNLCESQHISSTYVVMSGLKNKIVGDPPGIESDEDSSDTDSQSNGGDADLPPVTFLRSGSPRPIFNSPQQSIGENRFILSKQLNNHNADKLSEPSLDELSLTLPPQGCVGEMERTEKTTFQEMEKYRSIYHASNNGCVNGETTQETDNGDYEDTVGILYKPSGDVSFVKRNSMTPQPAVFSAENKEIHSYETVKPCTASPLDEMRDVTDVDISKENASFKTLPDVCRNVIEICKDNDQNECSSIKCASQMNIDNNIILNNEDDTCLSGIVDKMPPSQKCSQIDDTDKKEMEKRERTTFSAQLIETFDETEDNQFIDDESQSILCCHDRAESLDNHVRMSTLSKKHLEPSLENLMSENEERQPSAPSFGESQCNAIEDSPAQEETLPDRQSKPQNNENETYEEVTTSKTIETEPILSADIAKEMEVSESSKHFTVTSKKSESISFVPQKTELVLKEMSSLSNVSEENSISSKEMKLDTIEYSTPPENTRWVQEDHLTPFKEQSSGERSSSGKKLEMSRRKTRRGLASKNNTANLLPSEPHPKGILSPAAKAALDLEFSKTSSIPESKENGHGLQESSTYNRDENNELEKEIGAMLESRPKGDTLPKEIQPNIKNMQIGNRDKDSEQENSISKHNFSVTSDKENHLEKGRILEEDADVESLHFSFNGNADTCVNGKENHQEKFCLRNGRGLDPMVVGESDVEDSLTALPLTSSPLHAGSGSNLNEDMEASFIYVTNDDTDDDSDKQLRPTKKRRRLQITSDSDSEREKTNTSQDNATSSSALSSQSELLSTQQRDVLENEVATLQQDIAQYEAVLHETDSVSGAPSLTEENCNSDDMNSDLMAISSKSNIEDKDGGDGDNSDDDLFICASSPSPRKPQVSIVVPRVSAVNSGKRKEFPSQLQPKGGLMPRRRALEFTQQNDSGADGSLDKYAGSKQTQDLSLSPVLSRRKENGLHQPSKNATGCGNNEISLVATGLKSQEQEMLQKFRHFFNVKFNSTFVSGVTHVVVKSVDDINLVCERTLKFFLGLVHKAWIVDFSWIHQSLIHGQILKEDKYEIRGDIFSGETSFSPSKARLSKQLLLADYSFACVGTCAELSRNDMKELLVACGANVMEDLIALPLSASKHKYIIRCNDVDEEPSTMEKTLLKSLYEQTGLLTLSRDWVLDCISSYQVIPVKGYQIKL